VIYSMNGVEDYIHRIGRTGRGVDGVGHALVFFEFSDKQPETAKELIAVLHKSKQPVPLELEKMAQEIESGARGTKSWGSWSGGGGGSSWKTKDWGNKWEEKKAE